MPNENDSKLVTLADLGVAYDNLNTNKKSVQTAVTDPTASGTAVSFIDSISQNAQGVITPTKKTVAEATTSASGLMSSTDKGKLDGIEVGAQVNTVNSVNNKTGAVVLEAEDVSAIKDDYSYDAAAYPYTGQELILLHNVTTGENTVTDVASFLSSAGGGSGTNQGALVHYTKTISVSAGSTAQTFQDDNITADMVVLQAVIANPAAQGSDWTFTTSNGSVVLNNGIVTEATTVTLYFGVSLSAAPSIQVNLASTAADNILKTNPTPGVMGTLNRSNGGTGVSASDASDLLSKLGAVNKAGDTMTGPLTVTGADIILTNGWLKGYNGHAIWLGHQGDNKMQFHEYGGQFDFYKTTSATSKTLLFQITDGVSAKPLPVNNGGTGATTPAQALINLGILVDKYSDYSTNIVSKWNRGFLSSGSATVQYIDGMVYISVSGITTKTASQDWLLHLKSDYKPPISNAYYYYFSDNTAKRCIINSSGYLYLADGLDTTSNISVVISYAI